jgi:hypothetical protein
MSPVVEFARFPETDSHVNTASQVFYMALSRLLNYNNFTPEMGFV